MTQEMGGFYEWALKQTNRSDEIGDITGDIRRDSGFPKGMSSKKSLLEYMRTKSSDSNVLEAAEAAYAEYRLNKTTS